MPRRWKEIIILLNCYICDSAGVDNEFISVFICELGYMDEVSLGEMGCYFQYNGCLL